MGRGRVIFKNVKKLTFLGEGSYSNVKKLTFLGEGPSYLNESDFLCGLHNGDKKKNSTTEKMKKGVLSASYQAEKFINVSTYF